MTTQGKLNSNSNETCPYRYCGSESYTTFNRCNSCEHEWPFVRSATPEPGEQTKEEDLGLTEASGTNMLPVPQMALHEKDALLLTDCARFLGELQGVLTHLGPQHAQHNAEIMAVATRIETRLSENGPKSSDATGASSKESSAAVPALLGQEEGEQPSGE